MKQDTEHIKRLLLHRATGTLTADEERELEQWMAESDANRQLATRLGDEGYVLSALKHRQMIDTRRPLEDMQRRIGTTRRRQWLRRVSWAAAACLVMAAAAGLLWTATRRDATPIDPAAQVAAITPGYAHAVVTLPDGSTREVANMQELQAVLSDDTPQPTAQTQSSAPLDLTVPRGGEFHIVLADSSEVWLNAESRLVCADSYGNTDRRVKLQGEAYFKVRKDASRPFVVESDGQQVRVYGTEFNVRSYADGDATRTTLVQGSIALAPTHSGGGELMLTPGQQAVLDGGKASLRTVNTDVVTSWRQGRFVFEDQTLEQIMADLARWYDFRYEFRDEATRHIVFVGSIPRYAKFETALSILAATGNISYEIAQADGATTICFAHK